MHSCGLERAIVDKHTIAGLRLDQGPYPSCFGSLLLVLPSCCASEMSVWAAATGWPDCCTSLAHAAATSCRLQMRHKPAQLQRQKHLATRYHAFEDQDCTCKVLTQCECAVCLPTSGRDDMNNVANRKAAHTPTCPPVAVSTSKQAAKVCTVR